ncbi:MAG: hypothetical protein AMXMBFR58_19300 [Phycisphaerae bacterium]
MLVGAESSIQVHFGRAMPLFALDTVTLLPQQALKLHIFEPRYRQMLEHVLDGSGQFAMAVFSGSGWKQNYHGRPAIRPAVCVGHVIEHQKLADGTYHVLLQGVCRARIIYELPPSVDTLYRQAMIEPIGGDEIDQEQLQPVRERLEELLTGTSLSQLRAARPVLQFVRNEEVPTSVVMELVSFTLLNDRELRYKLLEEGDPSTRATLIFGELLSLRTLIDRARHQHPELWPKGCSWN